MSDEGAVSWTALDWLVRVVAPHFMDLGGLSTDAAKLRRLPRLVGNEGDLPTRTHEIRKVTPSPVSYTNEARYRSEVETFRRIEAEVDEVLERCGVLKARLAGETVWPELALEAWGMARGAAIYAVRRSGDGTDILRPSEAALMPSKPDVLDRQNDDPAHLRMTEAANDGDMLTRRDVAADPRTPVGLLYALAHDTEMVVRHAVAGNRCAPASALRRLLREPNDVLHEAVAGNPGAPEFILEVVRSWGSPVAQLVLLSNPSATERMLRKMADNLRPDVQQAARDRLRVVAQARARGAESPLPPTRDGSDQKSGYSEDTADRIGRLPADSRRALAQSEGATGEMLTVLAEDEDPLVRVAVAEHGSTPVKKLLELTSDADERVRLSLTRRWVMIPEVFALLATDTSEDIRQKVASDTRTREETLAVLEADPSKEVRWKAARELASRRARRHRH